MDKISYCIRNVVQFQFRRPVATGQPQPPPPPPINIASERSYSSINALSGQRQLTPIGISSGELHSTSIDIFSEQSDQDQPMNSLSGQPHPSGFYHPSGVYHPSGTYHQSGTYRPSGIYHPSRQSNQSTNFPWEQSYSSMNTSSGQFYPRSTTAITNEYTFSTPRF
jgi:hypothetical protein